MINDVFDTHLIALEFPITNTTQNFIKILSIQLIPSGQYQPPPIPPAIAKQLLRGKANN